ncbi:Lsr2 family DNA-binding protein [Arthrobacter woluwensis]|uniref:Lsr2 family DNA-binding protein n=1 Tax=Arthrobacter woluwensis TaxID=156980 RepID=UPI003C79F6EB
MTGKRNANRPRPNKPDLDRIREWASANGYTVAARGRIARRSSRHIRSSESMSGGSTMDPITRALRENRGCNHPRQGTRGESDVTISNATCRGGVIEDDLVGPTGIEPMTSTV